MLSSRLPLLSVWMSTLSLWSLWPLLCRDGLVAPLIILGSGYAVALWPSVEAVEHGDAALVSRMLRTLLQCFPGAHLAPSSRTTAVWLRASAGASALPAIVLSIAAATLPPPGRLPDLWTFATAVYACGLLLAAWLTCSTALLMGTISVGAEVADQPSLPTKSR